MEFHCKILSSYALYRCKKMVKILNCNLFAKKSYGTLSKAAIFLANPVVLLMTLHREISIALIEQEAPNNLAAFRVRWWINFFFD